jgi:hypothetical protein
VDIIISSDVTCYSWKIAHLALNSNHSFTPILNLFTVFKIKQAQCSIFLTGNNWYDIKIKLEKTCFCCFCLHFFFINQNLVWKIDTYFWPYNILISLLPYNQASRHTWSTHWSWCVHVSQVCVTWHHFHGFLTLLNLHLTSFRDYVSFSITIYITTKNHYMWSTHCPWRVHVTQA